MSLRTIMIFPKFDNISIINGIRKEFDPLAELVQPHITIVFPFDDDMSNDELNSILDDRLKNIKLFDKVCSIDTEFRTRVTKISVEMIGENEESIIVIEKKLS